MENISRKWFYLLSVILFIVCAEGAQQLIDHTNIVDYFWPAALAPMLLRLMAPVMFYLYLYGEKK